MCTVKTTGTTNQSWSCMIEWNVITGKCHFLNLFLPPVLWDNVGIFRLVLLVLVVLFFCSCFVLLSLKHPFVLSTTSEPEAVWWWSPKRLGQSCMGEHPLVFFRHQILQRKAPLAVGICTHLRVAALPQPSCIPCYNCNCKLCDYK